MQWYSSLGLIATCWGSLKLKIVWYYVMSTYVYLYNLSISCSSISEIIIRYLFLYVRKVYNALGGRSWLYARIGENLLSHFWGDFLVNFDILCPGLLNWNDSIEVWRIVSNKLSKIWHKYTTLTLLQLLPLNSPCIYSVI